MARASNLLFGAWGVAVLLGLVACKADSEGLPRREIQLIQDGKAVSLNVEIAATPQSRERGLMYRQHMPMEEGMLFVWPRAGRLAFWMKNTPLPLDMLFLREHAVVAVIPWAKPMDETTLDPGVEADMVLEVNGGWAATHGIGTGAQLTVSGTLPAAF